MNEIYHTAKCGNYVRLLLAVQASTFRRYSQGILSTDKAASDPWFPGNDLLKFKMPIKFEIDNNEKLQKELQPTALREHYCEFVTVIYRMMK